MLSTRWQKLWLLTALVLLFFPGIFILMEVPTEARILNQWVTRILWKIQTENPEYRELGVWYIRQEYAGLSDRDLIQALESRFNGIDYSAIRNQYSGQLQNIRWDQFRVVVEAISVYSLVVTFLYGNFWLVIRIVRRIKSSPPG